MIYILLVVLIVALAIYLNNKRYEKFVCEHSIALQKLKEINQRFVFHKIPKFDMTHSYDHDISFENISPLDYLTYQLVYKRNEVRHAIKDTAENKTLYVVYQNEIEEISYANYDTEEVLKNRQKLLETEKRLFQLSSLKPTVKFDIYVCLYQTKINGRLVDKKTDVFDVDEIESIIERLNHKRGDFYLDEEIWQSICRVERGRVSNKMRFAIYERDGYRCRKCGSRSDDLEIDHIFPISKGGKSNFENLQTLCHRCNSKKSNTIEQGVIDPRARRQNVTQTCPNCGATLVKRKGKYGAFYGCPNYPKCKYTQQIN